MRVMGARSTAGALALLLGLLTLPAQAVSPEQERDLYLAAMQLMAAGKHAQARDALERLIAVEPQHAGAWLDLAISQCALGQASEAERLFREIEVRFAPSAGILEVIDSHRRQGCRAWVARSSAAVTLARGRDSNVNQGASNPVFATGSGPDRIEHLLADDFLPQADQYSQATLDYTRELNAIGSVVLAQARARHYDSLHRQDTTALLLGLDQPLQLGRWDTRGLATVSLVTLGGQLYQRQLQLQARVSPPLPLPANSGVVLAASLGQVDYVRRTNFDATTGELSALWNYQGQRSHVQVAAGALLDHGASERLGGDRHGWYNSAQWQLRTGNDYLAELGWTRQDWRGERVYSAELVDQVRHQSTRQWRAALTRQLSAQHSVQLEWRSVYNKENISLFQYHSQSAQLNWRWTGF